MERNSHDKRSNNFYLDREIEVVEKLSGLKLQYKTAGKSFTHYEIVCVCEKSASNYKSCDLLSMNDEVGERWALNQLQNLKLQFTKQGLKICRRFENLSGVPTNYYVFNYRKG